jgi:predicted MFS family arabinose efflux permease
VLPVTGPATPRSSWHALALLFVVSVFNFLDRTLIGILQIPLKAELHLTDTQLGLLIGAAFGLVYTLFGLPLGSLADRTSRKWVLVVALTVWTTLTGLSGLAGSFAVLIICRMGVAFGEAACAPISHSLISDLFPPHRRGSGVAIWAMGVPFGTVLGFLAGGFLNETLGWRHSFMFVGAAGLLLVPLLVFGLKDPVRGAFDANPVAAQPPPLREMLRTIARNRTYCVILVAAALHLLTSHSTGAWSPQLYARVLHVPVREVGAIMALLAGVGGLVSMSLGGFLGDRLARRDLRWQLWLAALTIAIGVPFALAQYWAPSVAGSVTFGLLHAFVAGAWFAPMIALTQSLMPARIRTFTGAVYVSVVNVISMTLGPVITGRISDVLSAQADIGDQALRYALTAIQLGSLLSIGFFLLAARSVREDLALGAGRPNLQAVAG